MITGKVFQIICINFKLVLLAGSKQCFAMAFPFFAFPPISLVLLGLVGPVCRDEGHAMRAEVCVKVRGFVKAPATHPAAHPSLPLLARFR